MAKPDWLTDGAAVFVAHLGKHGLVIESDIARKIVSNRVLELSDTMGISATTAKKHVPAYRSCVKTGFAPAASAATMAESTLVRNLPTRSG